MSNLKDILAISLGAVSGVVVWNVQNLAHSYYREKHPKKQKTIFIDPRSDFEKFMNSFNYYSKGTNNIYNNELKDWVKYCPWPNLNPNTWFGKFATKNGYFKHKKDGIVENTISPVPASYK